MLSKLQGKSKFAFNPPPPHTHTKRKERKKASRGWRVPHGGNSPKSLVYVLWRVKLIRHPQSNFLKRPSKWGTILQMNHKPKEYRYFTDFSLTWKTIRWNKTEFLWGRGIPWRKAGAVCCFQKMDGRDMDPLGEWGRNSQRWRFCLGGEKSMSDVDCEKSRTKITES